MSSLTYRAVFISDTHLGMRAAKTEYLLDFLRHIDCDTLYLVGDIIDGWKLKSGRWYWPAVNNDIIRLVTQKAMQGTRVIYVPGNHDEALRRYLDVEIAGVSIVGEAFHTTVDGRTFLVLHGDEFDAVVMHNKWLAHLGSWAYDGLLWLNRWFNLARRKLGFGYWSLSAYLKSQVKEAVKHIGNFEDAVVMAGRERGVQGIICGHIHHPVISDFDGLVYANCGDWVESCTALVENAEGQLQLIHWVDDSAQLIDNEVPLYHADSDTDRCLASSGQRGHPYPCQDC